jgi:hypothetical protein
MKTWKIVVWAVKYAAVLKWGYSSGHLANSIKRLKNETGVDRIDNKVFASGARNTF